MPELDIQAAKKRCLAATSEPWRAGYKDGSAPHDVMTVAEHESQTSVGVRVESGKTDRGKFVSFTRDDTVPPLLFPATPDLICKTADDDLPEAEQLANADFIAHARSDLPAALEALEAVQRELDEVEANHLPRLGLWFALDRILSEEKE